MPHMPAMTAAEHADLLEGLYSRYNRREYVHPDPLEFLHLYEDPSDREVCGLISSSLAYGRVKQILKSVSSVLDKMGPRPSRFLRDSTHLSIKSTFSGFKHRFTTGEELSLTLIGVKRILEEHGSLESCFISGLNKNETCEGDTIHAPLLSFAKTLNTPFDCGLNSLIPSHEKKSSMKRLNLFLRWMVRRDDVDPGGWERVSPSQLMIPLDIHMHRISRKLGFTERKQADIRTVIEVTDAFRKISPDDPVKYDFVLTRFGIREEMDPDDLLSVEPFNSVCVKS